MVHPLLTKAPPIRPSSSPPPSYNIKAMLGAYVTCILTSIIACLLLTPLVLVLTYFPMGIFLCRLINRQIERHPLWANVENVAMANKYMVLSWPHAVPRFMWKLVWAKYL